MVELVPAAFAATTGVAVRLLGSVTGVSGTPADLAFEAAGQRFFVGFAASGEAMPVASAGQQLRAHLAALGPEWLPLVVVPYMGPVGEAICAAEGIHWLDLSGNAEIQVPGLTVRVRGRENRFKRRGRPSDLFSPAAAGLARALLLEPSRAFSQGQLATASGLSAGSVSKLLPAYEAAGFVTTAPEGRRTIVRAARPHLLLEAWRAAYRFDRHDIRRGHLAARSGLEVARLLTERLATRSLRHAATGLVAAWLYAPFASFRLATVYVERWPSDAELREIGFHEEPRGANVWLVRPAHAGVFAQGAEIDGIRCVSAVQTYLDLGGQPERAEEAAEELARVCLGHLRRADE